MNYGQTKPCTECPFLIGSGFTYRSLQEHASGEFACHKACDLGDDGQYRARNEKTPHCAGALIFPEAQDKPRQMMRICERLGLYDRKKLDMTQPVVRSPRDCRPDDDYDPTTWSPDR